MLVGFWVGFWLAAVYADSADLEACVAPRANNAQTKLGHVARRTNAALNGIGVFGLIRDYVTEVSLQAKMCEVDHEFKVLPARASDFVVLFDGHSSRLGAWSRSSADM